MSEYIIRERFDSHFAQVPKHALKDKNLSLKAKGLYCYLFSLPEDWKVHKKEIVTHFSDGKDSLNSAFKELEHFGYLVATTVRDKDTKQFKGTSLKLLIIPIEKPLRENRDGKPVHGETDSGKPATTNKDNKDIDSNNNSLFSNKEAPTCLDTFIESFNKKRKSKFSLTKSVKAQLIQRLKKYSCDDILGALDNAMKNDIHIKNNFNSITPAFITREDVIEMYLNFKPVESNGINGSIVFNKKFHDILSGKELTDYWKSLRTAGWVPKKDHKGNVVEWIKPN